MGLRYDILTKAISAAAGTANQEVIAAPADDREIWVYGYEGSADTGGGSVSFQDEDDVAITGVMPIAQNARIGLMSSNFDIPIWKVPAGKALEIDTVTCGFKGWISYAVVPSY